MNTRTKPRTFVMAVCLQLIQCIRLKENDQLISLASNAAMMAAGTERAGGFCKTLGCRKSRQPCEGTKRERGESDSCRESRRWASRLVPRSNSYARGAITLRRGRWAAQGEFGGRWDGAGGSPPAGTHDEQWCVALTTRLLSRTHLM